LVCWDITGDITPSSYSFFTSQLRITGGTAKNRKLIGPKSGWKNNVRPTSDRVREAIFSILGDRVREAHVLDLFAGSGSLGLEAVSRGAEKVVFVDRSSLCLNLIRRNFLQCFPGSRAEFLRFDLRTKKSFVLLQNTLSAEKKFQLIFLDPPYEKNLAETTLTMVDRAGLLSDGGVIIAEERKNAAMPERTGSLRLQEHRRYGETGIWIYTMHPAAAIKQRNPSRSDYPILKKSTDT
jgi:16S rRNA (guanine966-N2)-methyltransferase